MAKRTFNEQEIKSMQKSVSTVARWMKLMLIRLRASELRVC